jgi:lipopolysaccharide/colanic/teichoic acid biosynthesis glycosyltransferase
VAALLDETGFQGLLALERRRSERNPDHRYGLVLVDMRALSDTLDSVAMDEIGTAVSTAMRETDITGWYEDLTVIGVILTTLNGERSTIEGVVVKRITGALASFLSPAQIRRVTFTCYLFPEDGDNIESGQRPGSGGATSRLLKRSVDMAGSAAALAMLSPLILAITVVIRMTSPGPVFFRQRRVGQFGREFTCLKFRSMVVNNDSSIHQKYVEALIENKAGGNGEFKIKDDPRITPVGRFIRRTSIDELPQFFNVLKGDMSLVGPRPPIPYEMDKYSLWHRRRVLEAKPGITGVWQVYGRSRTTFDDMVRMDLRYIRHRSFWLDLKLLIKTPYVVLKGNGAY